MTVVAARGSAGSEMPASLDEGGAPTRPIARGRAPEDSVGPSQERARSSARQNGNLLAEGEILDWRARCGFGARTWLRQSTVSRSERTAAVYQFGRRPYPPGKRPRFQLDRILAKDTPVDQGIDAAMVLRQALDRPAQRLVLACEVGEDARVLGVVVPVQRGSRAPPLVTQPGRRLDRRCPSASNATPNLRISQQNPWCDIMTAVAIDAAPVTFKSQVVHLRRLSVI
jgi:hypothetical protein